VQIAPSPRPKESENCLVDPKEEKMTGCCLKYMDPNKRLAFIKIVSGTLKETNYHVRQKKESKIFKSERLFRRERL
jgi:peptide chain release factor 3